MQKVTDNLKFRRYELRSGEEKLRSIWKIGGKSITYSNYSKPFIINKMTGDYAKQL